MSGGLISEIRFFVERANIWITIRRDDNDNVEAAETITRLVRELSRNEDVGPVLRRLIGELPNSQPHPT